MSKSGLLLSPCTAWAGPGAQWYDENIVPHQERSDGTLFHEQAQSILEGGQAEIHLPEPVATWTKHAAKYIHQVLLPSLQTAFAEVPVGVNWLTGEAELVPKKPGSAHRDYPDRPGWQYGTADVVGIRTDGKLYVGDWKTGGSDGAREQLLSLAYGLQKCMTSQDAPDADVGLPYRPVVIACLCVNENGVWPQEEEISDDELRSHADSMRFVIEDLGKTYDPQPGVHCTALYCPHLAYCDAIQAHSQRFAEAAPSGTPQILPSEFLVRKATDKPADDEEAGFTQAMVSAVNRQQKYLTEANKKRITSGAGRVTFGQYVWEDRGNGFRWYKN